MSLCGGGWGGGGLHVCGFITSLEHFDDLDSQ